jgi:hypothetical protein
MTWLKSRLSEPSTWAALFTVGSVFFGLDLTPDQQYAISGLAVALFVTKG